LSVSKPVLEACLVPALDEYDEPLSNFAFNFNTRRDLRKGGGSGIDLQRSDACVHGITGATGATLRIIWMRFVSRVVTG
jgi:hypothetical protein